MTGPNDDLDRAIDRLYGEDAAADSRGERGEDALDRTISRLYDQPLPADDDFWGGSPDDIAGDIRRERTRGYPRPDNPEMRRVFSEEDERLAMEEILRSAPATRRAMTNPDIAGVARDQVREMSAFERRVTEAVERGEQQFRRREARDSARDRLQQIATERSVLERERRRAMDDDLAKRLAPGFPDEMQRPEDRSFVASRFPHLADTAPVEPLQARIQELDEEYARVRLEAEESGVFDKLDEAEPRFRERVNALDIAVAESDEAIIRGVAETGEVRIGSPESDELLLYMERNGLDPMQLKAESRDGQRVYVVPEEIRPGVVQVMRDMREPRKRVLDAQARIDELRASIEHEYYAPGSTEELAAEAFLSVAENAPALLVSIATRNPSIMMVDVGFRGFTAGFQAAHDLNRELREQGEELLTLEEMQTVGILYAAAEAIPELAQFGALMRVIEETRGAMRVGAAAVAGAATEAPTEAVTSLAQSGIDAAYLDSDKTVQQVIRDAVRDGKIGAIAGFVMGAGGGGVAAVRGGLDERQKRRLQQIERQRKAKDEVIEAAAAELEELAAATREDLGPLKDRSPEAAEKVISDTLNQNDQDDVFHVDIADIDEATGEGKLFQTEGQADAYFERQLGVEKGAMERARAARAGAVSFPKSRWLARVAGSSAESWFVDHYRTEPDAESRADVKNRRAAEVARRAREAAPTTADEVDAIYSGDKGAMELLDAIQRDAMTRAPDGQPAYQQDQARVMAATLAAPFVVAAHELNRGRAEEDVVTPLELYRNGVSAPLMAGGVTVTDTDGPRKMRPSPPAPTRMTPGQFAARLERERRSRERGVAREERDADRGVAGGTGIEFAIEDAEQPVAPRAAEAVVEALPPAKVGRKREDLEAARQDGRLADVLKAMSDRQAMAYARELRKQMRGDEAIDDPRAFVEEVAEQIARRNLDVDSVDAERARADYEIAVRAIGAEAARQAMPDGPPVGSMQLRGVPAPASSGELDAEIGAAESGAPADVELEVLPLPDKRVDEVMASLDGRFALAPQQMVSLSEIRSKPRRVADPSIYRVVSSVTAIVLTPEGLVHPQSMPTFERLVSAGATEIPAHRIVDAPGRDRLAEPNAVRDAVTEALSLEGVPKAERDKRARMAQDYADGFRRLAEAGRDSFRGSSAAREAPEYGSDGAGARGVDETGVNDTAADPGAGEARKVSGDVGADADLDRRVRPARTNPGGDAASGADDAQADPEAGARRPSEPPDGELDQLKAAGPESDQALLALAREMIAHGVDPATGRAVTAGDIWRMTGFRLAEDGEIEEFLDTSDAKISAFVWDWMSQSAANDPSGYATMTLPLGQLLGFPALYSIERYAHLQHTPVELVVSAQPGDPHGVRRDDGSISVTAGSLAELDLLLAHELQHAMDRVDGRPPGGNPELVSVLVRRAALAQNQAAFRLMLEAEGRAAAESFAATFGVRPSPRPLAMLMATAGFEHLDPLNRLPDALAHWGIDPTTHAAWVMGDTAAAALRSRMENEPRLAPVDAQIRADRHSIEAGGRRTQGFHGAYQEITGEARAAVAMLGRRMTEDQRRAEPPEQWRPTAETLSDFAGLPPNTLGDSWQPGEISIAPGASIIRETARLALEAFQSLYEARATGELAAIRGAIGMLGDIAKAGDAAHLDLAAVSIALAAVFPSMSADQATAVEQVVQTAASAPDSLDIDEAIRAITPVTAALQTLAAMDRAAILHAVPQLDLGIDETSEREIVRFDTAPLLDENGRAIALSSNKAARKRSEALKRAINAQAGEDLTERQYPDDAGAWGPVVALHPALGEIRVSPETVWKARAPTSKGRPVAAWLNLSDVIAGAAHVRSEDSYAAQAEKGAAADVAEHKIRNHRGKGIIGMHRLETVIEVGGEAVAVEITLRERLREPERVFSLELRDRETHPLWEDWKNGEEVGSDIYVYSIRGARPDRRDALLEEVAARPSSVTSTPKGRAQGQEEDTDAEAQSQAPDVELDQAIDQTGSPGFKAWFGDSKVVDESGRPLVVYHGTATSFDVFDPGKRGSSTNSRSSRQGFFFTKSAQVARGYANNAEEAPENRALVRWDQLDLMGEVSAADRLMKKIRAGDFSRDVAASIMPVYLSVQNPKIVDMEGREWIADRDEISITAMIDEAREQGHDGLILRNFEDSANIEDYEVTDHFVVFEPTQIKSAIGNQGTFDPNDPNILYQGQQRRRGWYSPQDAMIGLTNARDLSTFIHEGGHVILELYRQIAEMPNAPQRILDDYNRILTYAGGRHADMVKNPGDTPQQAQKRRGKYNQIHETFVAGLEMYLREGRAPTRELQPVFARVAGWLRKIYDGARALFGGQLLVQNDVDMREVFDRMYATEEQLQRAAQEMGFHRLEGKAADFGLSHAEWTAMREAEERAISSATERAIAAAAALHSKDAELIHRKRVEEELPNQRERLAREPVYRALGAFATGRVPPLSRPELAEEFPDLDLAKIPRGVLSAKTSEPMFESLDEAAAELGASSPRELLEILLGKHVENASETVNREATRIISAREALKEAKADLKNGDPATGDEAQRQVDSAEFELEQATDARAEAVEARTAATKRRQEIADRLLAADARRLRADQIRDLVSEIAFAGGDITTPMEQLFPKRGRRTIYTVQSDRVSDPEQIARWAGFTTRLGGAHGMLKAMIEAQPLEEAARAAAEEKMSATDPANQQLDTEKVIDLLHGEASMYALEEQIKVLARGAQSFGVNRRNAKTIARDQMSMETVREAVRLSRWLGAERQSGARAAEAQANLVRAAQKSRTALRVPALFESVLRWKESQLLNMAKVAESRRVERELAKLKRKAERLKKQFSRLRTGNRNEIQKNTIDAEYLEQIEALLHTYMLSTVSKKRTAELQSYLAWRQSMIDQGREAELADVPDRLLNITGRTNVVDLTVDEMRGLVEAIENLEHLGRMKQSGNKLKRAMEREQKVEELAEGVNDRRQRARSDPRNEGAETKGEKRKTRISSGWMSIMEIATIIQAQIDRGDPYGAGYQILAEPIDKAFRALGPRMREAAARWNALNAAYSEREWARMHRKRVVPDTDLKMSHTDRLAFALNWGNAGNREAIRQSTRYAGREDLIEAILDTLDKRDWKYVQSVWDYFEEFRPELAAKEKRLTGVEPVWVDATPVETKYGAFRGGYYPLRYGDPVSYGTFDPNPTESGSLIDPRNAMRRGKAGTKRDHTKTRVGSNHRPVLFDLNVAYQHTNTVIYDLVMGEAIAEVSGIISDRRFAEAMTSAGREAGLIELQKWIRDMADGESASSDAWSAAFRALRTNWTFGKLAWSLTTVAIQPTGLIQSWAKLGLTKPDMVIGIWQGLFNRGRVAQVYKDSEIMRQRAEAINKEVADALKRNRSNLLRLVLGRVAGDTFVELGYAMMAKVQMLVDIPTYLAAYNQALRRGMPKERAVLYAEKFVQESQGASTFARRSSWERGSQGNLQQAEFVKTFSVMMSYMALKPRMIYLKAADIWHARGAGGKMVATADLLATAIMIYWVEAVATLMIRELLRGDDWWEEQDDPAYAMAAAGVQSVLGSMPGSNFFAANVSGFHGSSAFTLSIDDISKLWAQIEQGEFDVPLAKSAITAFSLATPLPSAQINRSLEAGLASMEDSDVGFHEIMFGLDKD